MCIQVPLIFEFNSQQGESASCGCRIGRRDQPKACAPAATFVESIGRQREIWMSNSGSKQNSIGRVAMIGGDNRKSDAISGHPTDCFSGSASSVDVGKISSQFPIDRWAGAMCLLVLFIVALYPMLLSLGGPIMRRPVTGIGLPFSVLVAVFVLLCPVGLAIRFARQQRHSSAGAP